MSWGCYESLEDIPNPGGRGWEAEREVFIGEEPLKLSFPEGGSLCCRKWEGKTRLGNVKVQTCESTWPAEAVG